MATILDPVLSVVACGQGQELVAGARATPVEIETSRSPMELLAPFVASNTRLQSVQAFTISFPALAENDRFVMAEIKNVLMGL